MATMKFSTFDFSQHLDNPKTIAAYLDSILEEDDAGLLAAALGDIARARGMAEIAGASGLTREALYKALRPGSTPRFDTISRVLKVFDLELKIVAAKAGTQSKKQREARAETSRRKHHHSGLAR
jgi:probable addiction module antidote protein